jgi:NAD+ kinase
MMAQGGRPKSIAVTAPLSLPEAISEASLVVDFLASRGIHAIFGELMDEGLHKRVRDGEFQLVIALGGDGTMLRTGHLCAPLDVPILGINMGRFGFLYEVQRNDWRDILPQLLAGKYRLETRMMLNATLIRGKKDCGEWEVVNDVVVARGLVVRPVELSVSVDGYLLADYVADGMIASTATGSTAYALAAGGPILPPEVRNILILPVAPHLSVDRAIVLPEGSTVSIIVNTQHEAVLSVDGQKPVSITSGDKVEVAAGEHSMSFVRFQDPGYFYRNLVSYMEKNPLTDSMR